MKDSAYKKAGVDIEAGDEVVDRIAPHARRTRRPGVMGGLGGFGALFDPKAAGFTDPVLVSSTDGVGTKLKIAIDTGLHRTVGIDLVAMCVNDIVAQGATPLFFLDYFATGRLDPAQAEDVIAGIAEGCVQAGCALIGGETAEMPGLYAAGDYDLAGFAVGAAERGQLITGDTIAVGDIVLGLESSGVHSNGFSLVRALSDKYGYDARAPFAPEKTLGEALLTPTRIYAKAVAAGRSGVKGIAHITGGGLLENIPRILPPGLSVTLDARSWPWPPVFAWLAREGRIGADDLARTFNCGIGLVIICAVADAPRIEKSLARAGEKVHRIGIVTAGAGAVHIEHTADAWGLPD